MEQHLTNQVVSKLATKDQDMKGRRVINATDAVDLQDYVTLHDLQTKLAPSAYVDTTIADNISSGLLNNLRLPKPTYSRLGAVYAIAAVAHKFLTGLGLDGVFTTAQVAFSDLTGSITVGQIPASMKPVSVQQVVTGSRALNTVYQNTQVTPLFVTATLVNNTTSNTVGVLAKTDASNPPTTGVANMVFTNASVNNLVLYYPITFIVLPGNYYMISITQPTPTVQTWTEWY